MKLELSICSFVDYAFGVVSEKSLPYPRSLRFSSRSFISMSFYIRFETLFIIHFELIFVCSAKFESKFISAYGYPVVPAPLVVNTVLSPLNCLCVLSKSRCSHLRGSISGLCSVPRMYLPL